MKQAISAVEKQHHWWPHLHVHGSFQIGSPRVPGVDTRAGFVFGQVHSSAWERLGNTFLAGTVVTAARKSACHRIQEKALSWVSPHAALAVPHHHSGQDDGDSKLPLQWPSSR